MMSPSIKSCVTGIITQPIPYGIRSNTGINQPQVMLQSSMAKSTKQYQNINQPNPVIQTNLRISKSRSP